MLRLLLPKPFFWLLKPKVGYSFLCDYWSLGVAIYHMLYGYLPFRPDSKGCILDKVGIYTYHMLYDYLPFRQDSKGCILDNVGIYIYHMLIWLSAISSRQSKLYSG